MLYTQKALDHFYAPRNVGEIKNAHGSAQDGDPACGDVVRIWIIVQDERLERVTFKAFGCPAIIACCSMLTEMATGSILEEALRIHDSDVVLALGGMPDEKLHCSVFAASVLHSAIWAYKAHTSHTERYVKKSEDGG